MKTKSKKKRIIIICILIALCIAAVGLILVQHSSSKGSEKSNRTVEEQTANAGDTATLFFASDYQADPDAALPAETLGALIDQVKADGHSPTQVILCGDYSNVHGKWDYQISPNEAIEEIKGIIDKKCARAKAGETIFLQGNHDAMTEAISESGLHEYNNYLIYVMNTQDDFPWKQGVTSGAESIVEKTAQELQACLDQLISEGETRPVFIAAHVPLHFTARTSSKHSSGDNLYSKKIFDVLNKAGKSLNIVYLYGHNHSKGWDSYIGGSCVFKTAGDTILIPDYEDAGTTTDKYSVEQLNFIYMNAGYTGYYKNCGDDEEETEDQKAADHSLTGTVAEVKNGQVVLYRYDVNGMHQLGSKGEGNPYKNNIDADLIPKEYYSKKVTSPYTIN